MENSIYGSLIAQNEEHEVQKYTGEFSVVDISDVMRCL